MKAQREIFNEPHIAHSFSIVRIKNTVIDSTFFTRLTYHRIVFIEEGNGILSIDQHSYDIKKDEVFLISIGQIYRFENNATVSGYTISFGDCFWEKTPRSARDCKSVLFNNTTANQRLQLDKTAMQQLLFLMATLSTEYHSKPYYNQMDALASYLKIIMIKLANVQLHDEMRFESQDYLLYRQFMELVSSEFHQNHSVKTYAVSLHITARKLSETCKRCSGMGAKEVINAQLLAEAKRLLQFSSNTVKEIAYTLHFSSSEQFSNFFKKHSNSSPANYRSQFINIAQINPTIKP